MTDPMVLQVSPYVLELIDFHSNLEVTMQIKSKIVLSAVIFVAACAGIRIVPSPAVTPNFVATGGSACSACGGRALSVCSDEAVTNFPEWFGFDSAGSCIARCESGLNVAVGGIRGPENTACSYQVSLGLNFSGPVCPSGDPITGDRDFFGHGPRVMGSIHASPGLGGRDLVARADLIFSEVDRSTGVPVPDNSAIRLGPDFEVGSASWNGRPSSLAGASQRLFIRRIISRARTDINRVMQNSEEEIISPATGDPLIHQLVIVGDTMAGDISDDSNCSDDTRIRSISFLPVRVAIGP